MNFAAKISRPTLLPPGLPPSWGWSRLRWVSRIYAGGTPSRDKPEFWFNGSIPWLNSGAVNQWSISEPSELITSEALGASSARWIPAKSVVIALAGQGKTKGMAARLEIESTCNQSMAALVPSSKLDYRYLHYWLASNYESIRNLGGGDLRDGLNLQMIGDIDIPLPPIEQQRRIADFLDDQVGRIDQAIELRRGQRKLIEQQMRSLITKMVTGGEGAESGAPRRTPAMTFDTIPLNRVASVRARIGWKALTAAEYTPDGYAFLNTPNIKGREIDFENTNYINQHRWDESPELQLEKGDVLLAKDGSTLGIANVVLDLPRPATVNGSIAVIRPSAVDSRFLRYCLESTQMQAAIEMVKDGMGVPHLFQRDINRLQISKPPIEEQRRIADFLDDQVARRHDAMAHLTTSIASFEERKRSLITAVVTGQLDVTAARPVVVGS